MQTVKQIVCPNCQELNPAELTQCHFCGHAIAAAPAPRPVAPVETAPPPELPPLIWALVCAFVALWGLMAAGLLTPVVGYITHPYVLLFVLGAAVILTGLYLAERASHEPPPDRLLTSRDLMALAWATAALLGATQLVKYTVPPSPKIVRYTAIAPRESGCRVEVYVRGMPGDELWRLTGADRKDQKQIVGIIVRRPSGSSARLPMRLQTPQGSCAIARYHLLIDGRDADQVDGADK